MLLEKEITRKMLLHPIQEKNKQQNIPRLRLCIPKNKNIPHNIYLLFLVSLFEAEPSTAQKNSVPRRTGRHPNKLTISNDGPFRRKGALSRSTFRHVLVLYKFRAKRLIDSGGIFFDGLYHTLLRQLRKVRYKFTLYFQVVG